MTHQTAFLARIPWNKRIAQAIGIVYGLFGIPFIFALVAFIATLWEAVVGASGYTIPFTLGMGMILVGAPLVCLSLGVGFWRQKEWAYRIALVIHGLPLLASAIQWIASFQGGAQLYYSSLSLGVQLWNIGMVSFVLLPKARAWWMHHRETRYWHEPPRS